MTYEELEKEYEQIKIELASVEKDRDEYKNQVASLEEDIDSYKSEVEELQSDKDQLERDLTGTVETEEIELSFGKIYVNLDGLDYFTKESFKAWVKEHAITNSEPLFNA